MMKPVGGSQNTITGPTTYRDATISTCDLEVSGSNNTFNPAAAAAGIKPEPISYVPADFPCTGADVVVSAGGDLDLNGSGAWWQGNPSSSTLLKPGRYCALNDKLTLSRQYSTGNVTFVAREIDVSGSNFNLTARSRGVLLYATGTVAPFVPIIKAVGSSGNWVGAMYAPNGQIEVSGSGNQSLNGAIVGQTVKLSGSNWSISGASGAATVSRPKLLE